MKWYWILIIISAVIGPFEAMYALNKARNRRGTQKGRQKQEETDKREGKTASGGESEQEFI